MKNASMRQGKLNSRFGFIVAITVLAALVVGARSASAQSRPSATEPSIDPKLPTLWIIGDSTVRNGQDTGGNGQWGWGKPIHDYFDQTKINVQNWALGGTSSRTFQAGSRWAHVLYSMKPGDYLIMQFGHNDSGKPDDPSRARATLPGNGEETVEIDNPILKKHEVVHTYGWYIRQYVSLAKAKGASDVFICSPIPRNAWQNGKVNHNANFTRWAAEAAKMAGAKFIDLNTITATRYDAEGKQAVTDKYFPEKEVVHTDWAGAILNADSVVQGIKELDANGLGAYLLATPPRYLQLPAGKAR
ncbi:MAG: GDSL-type esterase/lipase family protein [Planctomycetota bacterium]|nr:GDSL-type esterase/lipase family protein [Planctomycetota bacterium]